MPEVRTISLPQLLGGVPTVLLSAIALIAVSLFVVGTIQRSKGGSWRTGSWLLRNTAVWTFLYGVILFAYAQANTYLRIGGGAGSSEIWSSAQGEAYSQLCVASAVALFAWTLHMILGKPTE